MGKVLLQALMLEVFAEGFGEAQRHRLQPLQQWLRPGQGAGLHLQRTEQHPVVAQG